MKQIEFRAWWSKEKIMIYPIYGQYIFHFGNDFQGIHDLNHPGQRFIQGSWLNLMQFTGLYDKNGKKIFEGDILEYYSHMVPKGSNPIRMQIVTWNEWHWEGILNWKSSKIIGNIYENPELIK